MRLLHALGQAFLGFDQFAARHWQKFVIAGGLILSVLTLRTCYEAGRYRAVIDRAYPLEQVVEATRYVETQQKTGNVVLTVSRNGTPPSRTS